MTEPEIFVGMDISKAQLDIAIRPEGRFAVANDAAGVAQLIQRMKALPAGLVVMEATGGLEIPIAGALAAAGMPVIVVNPRQVRDFPKATGQLAKTDILDAEVLARFAEAIRPEPRPLPDEQTQVLAALVVRRHQLIEMLTAEKNRSGECAAHHPEESAQAYRLARTGVAPGRHRPGRGHSAEPGLARKGRPAAQRPRYRPSPDRHAAGHSAGTGDVDT